MKRNKYITSFAILISMVTLLSCSDNIDDQLIDPWAEVGSAGAQNGSGTQLSNFELTFPVTDVHSELSQILTEEPVHIQLLLTGEEDLERIVMRALIESDGENFTISSEGDNIASFTQQSYLLVGAHVADPTDAMIEWLGEEIETVKNIGLLVHPHSDYSGLQVTSSFNSTKSGSVTIGSGEEGDPYMLYSVADINSYIRDNLPCNGVSYKLGNTIVLGEWEPMGYGNSTYFNGDLDGSSDSGGYSLVLMQGTGVDSGFGFFYGLYGSISNLDFKSVEISGVATLGVLSAQGSPDSVENVTVDGSITGSGGNIGGLIGYGCGNFTNCKSNIIISSTTTATNNNGIGGLVGYLYANSTFNKCRSAAVISCSEAEGVGGLVGHAVGSVAIDSCFVYGKVSGRYYVGGAVGLALRDVTITDSYVGDYQTGSSMSESESMISISNPDGTSGYGFGGMVGCIMGTSTSILNVTIANSVVASNNPDSPIISLSNVYNVGGLVGSADYADFKDCDYTCIGDIYIDPSSSSSNTHTIGGIIGSVNHSTFANCSFTNNSSLVASGFDKIGGVVGAANFDRSCTDSSQSTFHNKLSVTGGDYTGGIFGYVDQEAWVENMQFTTINDGYVTGGDYVGGITSSISADL